MGILFFISLQKQLLLATFPDKENNSWKQWIFNV